MTATISVAQGNCDSLFGVELTYDASILMDEDLSLVGKQREEILARFEPMMGDKAAQE